MAAKKRVIDLDTYNALDAYCIALNEYYKSLRKAGFSDPTALFLITEPSSFPSWILPAKPIEKIGSIDPDEYEDDD
jgi:hypothetical protein